ITLAPPDAWPQDRVLRLAVGGMTAGLQVEGAVELQKVLARVTKQKEEGLREATRIEKKLNSPEFTGKAPSDVVAEHRQRLHNLQTEHAFLSSSEDQLRRMAG
ncbi:MAG: hypothetical protein ACREI3_09725, partial [Nitrospirales bacterium]